MESEIQMATKDTATATVTATVTVTDPIATVPEPIVKLNNPKSALSYLEISQLRNHKYAAASEVAASAALSTSSAAASSAASAASALPEKQKND